MRLLVLCLALLAGGAASERSVWGREDVIDYDVPDEAGEPLSEADFECSVEMAESLPDALPSELGQDEDGNELSSTADGVREGDIKTPANFRSVKEFAEKSSSPYKNAIRNRWRQWPRGEIPYVMSARYSSYARRTIAAAFKEYHAKTCIKFVPRDPRKHRDYIYIHPDDGCYSLVGRTGGRQSLSLDSGCVQKGTIIHELMHTVGFFHEQSRTDRDDYIRIAWDNVMRDARDQFEKYSLRTITSLGEDYDYGSIMHYGPRAFSRNGRATIVPIARDGSTLRVSMGQRRKFSATDLRKINRLYNCAADDDAPTRPPAPETEEDGECRDLADGPDRRCFFWKRLGYCGRYETVQRRCRRTCGLCEGSEEAGTTKPTTTTAKPPPRPPAPEEEDSSEEDSSEGSEKDLNDNCAKWALTRKLCDKAAYKSLMGKLCAKSCRSARAAAATRRKETDSEADSEEECADENPGRCELIATLRRCPEYRVVRGQKCLTKNGWSNDLAKLYFRSCRSTCGLCEVKICRVVAKPRS